jgi:hypothetical protein
MGLFNKKTSKKSAKMTVVRPDAEPIIYDFETEKAACEDALVNLVGEQNAAEGFHFIASQCETDPQFVKMIFDPEQRKKLMGIMSNLNPAELLGGIAEKFAHIF